MEVLCAINIRLDSGDNSVSRFAHTEGDQTVCQFPLSCAQSELWGAVQELRSKTRGKGRTTQLRSGARLIGKVFDSLGNPMSPTITKKRSVRYRYYMTREHGLEGPKGSIHRVPMTGLEDAVVAEVTPQLAPSWRADVHDSAQRSMDAVLRVRIFPTELLIDIAAGALGGDTDAEPVILKCDVSFERPRNSTTLIRSGAPAVTKVDRSLLRAVDGSRMGEKTGGRRAAVHQRIGSRGGHLRASHSKALAPRLSGARPSGPDFGRAAAADAYSDGADI